MNSKNKKFIRFLIIAVYALAIVGIGVFAEIKSYFTFIVFSVFILQGIKAILDFMMGFTMKIGYAKPVEPNEENFALRITILFLSFILITVGVWWIITKELVGFS